MDYSHVGFDEVASFWVSKRGSRILSASLCFDSLAYRGKRVMQRISAGGLPSKSDGLELLWTLDMRNDSRELDDMYETCV